MVTNELMLFSDKTRDYFLVCTSASFSTSQYILSLNTWKNTQPKSRPQGEKNRSTRCEFPWALLHGNIDLVIAFYQLINLVPIRVKKIWHSIYDVRSEWLVDKATTNTATKVECFGYFPVVVDWFYSALLHLKDTLKLLRRELRNAFTTAAAGLISIRTGSAADFIPAARRRRPFLLDMREREEPETNKQANKRKVKQPQLCFHWFNHLTAREVMISWFVSHQNQVRGTFYYYCSVTRQHVQVTLQFWLYQMLTERCYALIWILDNSKGCNRSPCAPTVSTGHPLWEARVRFWRCLLLYHAVSESCNNRRWAYTCAILDH